MLKHFLSLLTVAACALSGLAAEPQTYRMEVQDFNELQVIDALDVVYRCNPDSAGMAVFTATPDVVPVIIFSNNKSKLKIQINSDTRPLPAKFPVITVYSNYLSAVENSGSGTVKVETLAPGAQFKARIIGNGTLIADNIHATQTEGSLDTGKGRLVLNGETRSAKFKNIGTGSIEASDLKAETVSVTILGTGPVECLASQELNVKGIGSGKVYVKGNPTVKKRSIGKIDVINIE